MRRVDPQNVIKPAHLEPGDTIGIIAPASPPRDPDAIDCGVAWLEQLGFRVKLAKHVRARAGFLAGTDTERAADLMQMFADPKVKAILCVRGGYGTGRLLPLVDYGLIRRNPKVFVGHSDVTALLCAIRARANLVTFHGPMLTGAFAKANLPAFTRESFLRTIMRPEAAGSICQGYNRRTVTTLHNGVAKGELVGGNLSVLCTLIGTPYQPVFRARILFFEDVDEPPYRIDRMLTHLLNAGLLQQVAGVAVGTNKNCNEPVVTKTKEYRQTLDDVLEDRLGALNVPVVIGLPFGHGAFNATIPIGGTALLDANNADLVLTEAPVA